MKPPHGLTALCLLRGKTRLVPRICMDPTNLIKAMVKEPYHLKTHEDIAHLLGDACIMSVCDCKKGYWHQKLDEASSFLTTLIESLEGLDIQ